MPEKRIAWQYPDWEKQRAPFSQYQSLINSLKSAFDDVDYGAWNPRLATCFIEPDVQSEREEKSVPGFHALDQFISNLQQHKVLLLTGDAGMGKTTMTQCYVKRCWEYYEKSKALPRYPIWIRMADIPRHRLYDILHWYQGQINSTSQTCSLEKLPLLIVLDGADTCPEWPRIYTGNHWDTYDIRCVITCRLQVVSYQDSVHTVPLFGSMKNGVSQIHYSCQPFTSQHQKDYIARYVRQREIHEEEQKTDNTKTTSINNRGEKKNNSQKKTLKINTIVQKKVLHWSAEHYWQVYHRMPGLMAMADNPCLFSLIIPSLPSLAAKQDSLPITRYQLYETFLSSWFAQQAQCQHVRPLLKKSLTHVLGKGHVGLACLMRLYARNLAYFGLSQGNTDLLFSEKETTDIRLLYPDGIILSDKQIGLRLRQATEEKENQSDMPTWSGAWFDDWTSKDMACLRASVLLRTVGAQFYFWHRSVEAFFIAEALFAVIGKVVSMQSYSNGPQGFPQIFYRHGFLQSPHLVRLLVERLKQARRAQYKILPHTRCAFEASLWQIIEWSKKYPYLGVLAGKAATLLNYADVPFSGQDLSHVCLIDADLSQVIAHRTNFKGSFFMRVRFDRSYLSRSDLSQSRFISVFWGVPHLLQLPQKKRITAVATHPQYDTYPWIALGDSQGTVRVWEDKKGWQAGWLTLSTWWHNHPVKVIQFYTTDTQPRCHYLAAISQQGRVGVWRQNKGRQKHFFDVFYSQNEESEKDIFHWKEVNITLSDAHKHPVKGIQWQAQQAWKSGKTTGILLLDEKGGVSHWALNIGKNGVVHKHSQTVSHASTVACLIPFSGGQYLAVLKGGEMHIDFYRYAPFPKLVRYAIYDHAVSITAHYWPQVTQLVIGDKKGRGHCLCLPQPNKKHRGVVKRVRIGDFEPYPIVDILADTRNGCHQFATATRRAVLVVQPDKVWCWYPAQKRLPTQIKSGVLGCIGGASQRAGSYILLHPRGYCSLESGLLPPPHPYPYTMGDRPYWEGMHTVCITTRSTDVPRYLCSENAQLAKQLKVSLPDWPLYARSTCGAWLAIGDMMGGTCTVWQVETGSRHATFSGHKGRMTHLRFSEDGQFLAIGMAEGTCRVWSVITQQCCASLLGHIWMTHLRFSGNNQWLAIADTATVCRIWAVKTGRCAAVLTPHKAGITFLNFSANHRLFVIADLAGTCRVWAVSPLKCMWEFSVGIPRIDRMLISKTGQWMVISGINGDISIWSLKYGRCVSKESHLFYFTGKITQLSFSQDERWCVISDGWKTVCLYEVSCQTVRRLSYVLWHHSTLVQLAFYQRDRLLVRDEDNRCSVWHVIEKGRLSLLYCSWVYPILCAKRLRLHGAQGLSSVQNEGLHQEGATGEVSKQPSQPMSLQAPWCIARFSKKIIDRTGFNILNQDSILTYQAGAVSLLRMANQSHVIILVQGINSMGCGFFIKYQLVPDRVHHDKATVVREVGLPFHPNKRDVVGQAFQAIIGEEWRLTGLRGATWDLSRLKQVTLARFIERSQQNPIPCRAWRDPNSRHNSGFAWAVSMLHGLNDTGITESLPMVPKCWQDYIAHDPKKYLTAPLNKACTEMIQQSDNMKKNPHPGV